MNAPKIVTPLDAPVPLSQVAYDAQVTVQDVVRLAWQLGWNDASAESAAPPIYASLLRLAFEPSAAILEAAKPRMVTPRGPYERLVLGNE